MWFAQRTLLCPYELGRAESADGDTWLREERDLTASSDDWEGGAATYPAVFHMLGRQWLLYNGSGYGVTGFGPAVSEE